MKKFVAIALTMVLMCLLTVNTNAASIALSADEQWIEGLSTSYEYITQTTYDKQGASAANNTYWTSLAGGTRPNGTKYAGFRLVEGHKLQVSSAWYGQDVYFRTRGSSGKGNIVKVPEFSQLKEKYKKTVRVFNAYSADTGMGFYGHYINDITDSNGYLINATAQINIAISDIIIDSFNKAPLNYLTDAEGNYIYDLVAIGAYTNAEPDISGAAAWALRDYISEGYGFLVGHDTMYGYGGVNPDENYTPNKADTSTPMYELNTKNNGHWNMNWLMGVNKLYTEARPYEAASMILNIGDYKDKSTLYGDDIIGNGGISELRIAAVTAGNPVSDINARCPTNYPYANRTDGVTMKNGITAGATHTNQQLAYGKVWVDFKSNTTGGKLLLDTNDGLTGTNNFYVTTNGNFGMMQIGHSKDNLNSAQVNEARILANTIMYLSQRQPCEICQSRQGSNTQLHAVKRISSAEELARIGNPDYWFTYPINGCYVLVNDIELPAAGSPIKGFAGHFNADNRRVKTNGKAVLEQKGVLGQYNVISPLSKGWNLGENADNGINKISNSSVLTGVARVEGYLNALLSTPSETDYSGYTVQITDQNGVVYDCRVTREGKYVLSNLPCTGTEYFARVKARDGADVVTAGTIIAKVPQGFWNSCETIPLQLKAAKAEPIEDKTVYEEQNAEYKSSFIGTAQGVRWEYKPSETVGWIDIKYSDVAYTIAPMSVSGGKTHSVLSLQGVLQKNNDYYYRAVYSFNGDEYNSFDVKTPHNSGRLIVLERPFEVISPINTTKWQGEEISFSATGVYYRSFDTGLRVEWQYRGNENCVWENVDSGGLTKDFYVLNSVRGLGDSVKPFANESVLVIKSASTDYEGYQLRAVFKLTTRIQAWASKAADVHIKIPSIACTQNPTSAKITLNSDGSFPAATTAAYSAAFTYTSKTGITPAINWTARNGIKGEFGTIPGNISVDIKTLAPRPTGRADEYVVSTTLVVKNPNISMDSNTTHYFFRASANLGVLNAVSDPADLTINYSIDIIPREPLMEKNTGDGYNFCYNKLQINAPIGLRVVRIKFQNGPQDYRNTINLPPAEGGIAVRREGEFYLFESGTPLSAAAWQSYLRKIVFTVYSTTENIYWYIDELENELEYNPDTGKYEKHEYEFVSSPNITWTQGFDAAQTRYNPRLNTYGHLATISSAYENERVRQAAGGNGAWIGATRNPMYNKTNTEIRWIGGKPIVYNNFRYDTPWEHEYAFMQPDGTWSLAPNVNEIDVMTTDTIAWENIDYDTSLPAAPGKWFISGEAPVVHFHVGENPNGDEWSGIALLHQDGASKGRTVATQYVYLENGHTYWFSTLFGESGDSNTSMEFYFNALNLSGYSDYSTWWWPTTNSQTRVEAVKAFNGATGYYPISYGTYAVAGANPAEEPYGYGQIFHCDLVDLTAAFGTSVAKATFEWCHDNLVSKSGSQWFKFTSNTSAMNGYVVEYELNDIGFGRSNHSAESVSSVVKPKEWATGREGVRVTVVDSNSGIPYRPSFDLSKNNNSDITRHYGYVCKTEYRNGAPLKVDGGAYISAQRALPKIVVTGGGTNLPAVKAYFSQNDTLSYIAGRVGLTSAQLTGGRYKILLEPVIYLPVNGGMYAMTATEAAMYNAQHSNALRDMHKSITHQALPFALYLTEDDLGFTAWSKAINAAVTDAEIVQKLGVCILRFGNATAPPNTTKMRTNTEVYLSCEVSTNGELEANPDSPAWVSFTVNGQALTHSNIYIPAGGSQRAYVKWKTPSAPGNYTVSITSSGNVKTNISSFVARVVELIEQTPPDPKATDRNDYFNRPLAVPKSAEALIASWLEYSCKRQGDKWEFTPTFHNAKLSLSVKTLPDVRVPTAIKEHLTWQMKSGYGFNVNAI